MKLLSGNEKSKQLKILTKDEKWDDETQTCSPIKVETAYNRAQPSPSSAVESRACKHPHSNHWTAANTTNVTASSVQLMCSTLISTLGLLHLLSLSMLADITNPLVDAIRPKPVSITPTTLQLKKMVITD